MTELVTEGLTNPQIGERLLVSRPALGMRQVVEVFAGDSRSAIWSRPNG